jgi:hypothetical protein
MRYDMKNKNYHTAGTFPKFNKKIVEKENDIPPLLVA